MCLHKCQMSWYGGKSVNLSCVLNTLNTHLNVPEELVKESPEQACPGSNGAPELAQSTTPEPILLLSSLPCVHMGSLKSATLEVLEWHPFSQFDLVQDVPWHGHFLLKTLQLGILWTNTSALGVSEAVRWLNAPTLRALVPALPFDTSPLFRRAHLPAQHWQLVGKPLTLRASMKIEWCPPANWVLEKKGQVKPETGTS